MKDIQMIKRTWPRETNFIQYPLAILRKLNLHADEIALLNEIGLPEQCAPYLHFYPVNKNGLKSLSSLIQDEDDLANRILLGGTGSGDSIVFNIEDHEIEHFDHETYEVDCMNTSLIQLLKFLHAFAYFIQNVQGIRGEALEHIVQELEENLIEIDSQAMEEGSFWYEAIEAYRETEY